VLPWAYVRGALFGLGELVLGFGVGYAWERFGGWLYPGVVATGVEVCTAVVLYASQTVNPCLAGADCEPTTWANWTLLGVGMIGFWVLSVGMGFAVSTSLGVHRAN
jgi:hypothetical protein